MINLKPMASKISQKTHSTIMLASVSVFAIVASGSASAAFVHDGILTSAGEYENSFQTEWYNDHQSLAFPEAGGQMTTIRYTDTGSEFRIYVEAPIEAKNMAWGTAFDFTVNPGLMNEAVLYYQAWCSPNDGNTAALDGSNCDHHDKGFSPASVGIDPSNKKAKETFIGGILSKDFKTMIDSEKVVFPGGKGNDFKLIDSKDGAKDKNGALTKSSLTYIFDNNGSGEMFDGCTEAGCIALGTTMSYELLFTGSDYSQGQNYVTALMDVDTDIIFHLSPERGAVVPVPAAAWLFGSGLLGLVGIARRKAQA